MLLCAGFTDNSTAGNTSHTVSCWFSKTSLSTCALFKYPWSAGLKVQSSRWMSMYFRTPWTLSQKDVVLLHHYNTPLPIASEIQMCTCSTYRNRVTPCSVLHHSFQCHHHWTSTDPISSINDRLLYNLSHVVSTTVSTSHHKKKACLTQ
jgi:hypothetical protein